MLNVKVEATFVRLENEFHLCWRRHANTERQQGFLLNPDFFV